MPVEADGIDATRIDDKNALVLRSSEIARYGRIEFPRLEVPEQSFVPRNMIRNVRRRHVVVDDQGRIRCIRFRQFCPEHLVIAGPTAQEAAPC